MWMLLIILLSATPGMDRVTVLHEYHTENACLVERNRVGFAMAEQYPGENSFVIACVFRVLKGQT